MIIVVMTVLMAVQATTPSMVAMAKTRFTARKETIQLKVAMEMTVFMVATIKTQFRGEKETT